tara:strand:- start:790 stop:1035 length:246 start_codon:yes stop_codon:yes gene_type:complete
MRTKKEVAEKLQEIKKLAKLEHEAQKKETVFKNRTVTFMMIGWLEALNFVLKNPIDSETGFAKEKQKVLENKTPIDFSQFW